MTLGILKQHSRCQYVVKPLLRLSLFSDTNLTTNIFICFFLKGKQSVIFSLSDMLNSILKYWKVILRNILLGHVVLSTVLGPICFWAFLWFDFCQNCSWYLDDFYMVTARTKMLGKIWFVLFLVSRRKKEKLKKLFV